MSKSRKSNGTSSRVKPKKAVASTPHGTKHHRKRRVDAGIAGKKQETGARDSVLGEIAQPRIAAAVASERETAVAPEREVRRTMPFSFWTRMPFAIMDMWFFPSRREDSRTGT